MIKFLTLQIPTIGNPSFLISRSVMVFYIFEIIYLVFNQERAKQLCIILIFSTLGIFLQNISYLFFFIGIIKKFFLAFLGVCDAPEPLERGNLGAENMEWLINLHNYVTDELIMILGLILALFLLYFTYTNFTYTIGINNKKVSHSKFLEIFWTILPAFTLLVIVCPIFNLLFLSSVVQNVPVLEASANISLPQPLSLLNMEAESPVVDSITGKALIGQAMLFVGASLIFGSGVGIVGPVLVIAGATCMAFGLDIDIPMDCSGRTSSLNSCSDSDNWDSSMSDTEPFFSDVLKKDKVVKPLVSDVLKKDKVVKPLVSDVLEKDKVVKPLVSDVLKKDKVVKPLVSDVFVLQPLVAEEKNTNKVAIQVDYIPTRIDRLNTISRNVNLTEFKSTNPDDVARQGEIRSVLSDIVADMKIYNEFGMDMETSKPTDGFYVSNNQLLITEYYPETETRSDSVVFDGRNPNVLHGPLGSLLAEPIVSPTINSTRPRVGLVITRKEVETLPPTLSLVIKSSPTVIEEVVVQSPPVVEELPSALDVQVVVSPQIAAQAPVLNVVIKSSPVVIEEVVVQSPPVVEELPSALDVQVVVSPQIAAQAPVLNVVIKSSPTVIEEVVVQSPPVVEELPSALDVQVVVSPQIAAQAPVLDVVTQPSPIATKEEVHEQAKQRLRAFKRAAADLRKKKF